MTVNWVKQTTCWHPPHMADVSPGSCGEIGEDPLSPVGELVNMIYVVTMSTQKEVHITFTREPKWFSRWLTLSPQLLTMDSPNG